MSEPRGREEERPQATVVVHRADSWTEAVVLRGLLESAGIESPPLTRTDPYPFSHPPAEFPGAEILVRESQVEDARHIIADYLAALPAESPENENEEDQPEEPRRG